MPRDLKPPFKFDVSSLVKRFRNLPASVDGVTINFPFATVSIKPDRTEQKAAREVVIRLADRRVLNAFECCDGCIEKALKSLQEIRQILVDKQVDLADKHDGALYLLIDSIRGAIRQFLTFEQRIGANRPYENRELYFAALEMLRAHIHRTLLQISKMAKMKIPGVTDHMRYDEDWQLEAYQEPKLLKT